MRMRSTHAHGLLIAASWTAAVIALAVRHVIIILKKNCGDRATFPPDPTRADSHDLRVCRRGPQIRWHPLGGSPSVLP